MLITSPSRLRTSLILQNSRRRHIPPSYLHMPSLPSLQLLYSPLELYKYISDHPQECFFNYISTPLLPIHSSLAPPLFPLPPLSSPLSTRESLLLLPPSPLPPSPPFPRRTPLPPTVSPSGRDPLVRRESSSQVHSLPRRGPVLGTAPQDLNRATGTTFSIQPCSLLFYEDGLFRTHPPRILPILRPSVPALIFHEDSSCATLVGVVYFCVPGRRLMSRKSRRTVSFALLALGLAKANKASASEADRRRQAEQIAR